MEFLPYRIGSGIYKPFVFSVSANGMRGAITHGRRSGAHRGAFEMDLTARGPSKVPRCFLKAKSNLATSTLTGQSGWYWELLSAARECWVKGRSGAQSPETRIIHELTTKHPNLSEASSYQSKHR
jgi:hypothetical protein